MYIILCTYTYTHTYTYTYTYTEIQQKSRIPQCPQDPYILDFLSKSLQAELRLARYHEHLSKLPFLASLLTNDMQSDSAVNR